MDPTVITFISALTALVASVLGPTVTLMSAKVQFNANVLSNNRQRWIHELRDLIASFMSQLVGASIARERLTHLSRREMMSDPAILARAEQLILTMSKIRLMINPLEADHRELIDLIDRGVSIIRDDRARTDGEIDENIDAVIAGVTRTSQAILKREWVRAKRGR